MPIRTPPSPCEATQRPTGGNTAGNRREAQAQTTIDEQRQNNVHLKGDTDEAAFVQMRQQRDATLPVPKLILPALQVNIRGGRLPEPDANGVRYLRLPLDQIGKAQ